MSLSEKKRPYFLISNPKIATGSVFSQAVICIYNHSPQGAFGFILNKKAPPCPSLLLYPFSSSEEDPLSGGPLARSSLFMLYQKNNGSIYYTSNLKTIRNLLEKNTFPKNLLLKGISFWRPLQLDGEIKENYWIPCCPSINFFNVCRNNRYQHALTEMNLAPSRFYSICGTS
ncbi:MAG TPA: YqgE/AlgH family protein [Gammaproteobacteria bacterium]|nr:YqgE/AlgH family protein [Gammaproteobacteria bacterium]